MTSATTTAPGRTGWTGLSIALHWLIVLLVLVQFFDHEAMVGMWRAAGAGTLIDRVTFNFGWLHIVSGSLILVGSLVRLCDRLARGRPPYPADEPSWAL